MHKTTVKYFGTLVFVPARGMKAAAISFSDRKTNFQNGIVVLCRRQPIGDSEPGWLKEKAIGDLAFR